MGKTNVHVIEIVTDAELRKKEAKATRILKQFFPDAGGLRLYRTADGQIGIQIDLDLKPGDRQRLDKVYDEIMKILGGKRGRPRGVKKVQTKLMLPEPAYRSLKRAAAEANSTMSDLVAELASRLEKSAAP